MEEELMTNGDSVEAILQSDLIVEFLEESTQETSGQEVNIDTDAEVELGFAELLNSAEFSNLSLPLREVTSLLVQKETMKYLL